MRPSETDRLYLEEITASRYPVAMDDQPPLRIDITGVGEEPTAPEEVKPELVAPVVAPESPSMTAYDPTIRERLAEFLQAGFESFGMERFQARRQAQSLVGGPSSNLPLQLGVADIVPFLGTGLQTQEAGRMLEDAADFAQRGEYGEAAISATAGALGLVPGAVGTVKAARQVGELANVVGDKAVQAITGNPQATAMGALEAAGQMSPVSRISPGVEAQAVQPIKDDSRLLMPAFLDKTKQMESGFIKLNSPIKMKDGSTLSGFESADQKVFYGRDKNGVDFNIPREYVNPDDFVSSRDGNKTMEKIKANLVESRSPGLTLDVAPSVRTKNFKNWFGDSKVVDSKGKPLVVYHGTGNLEGMKSFDPALTGQGLDQLGSGFYFTTNAEEASGYSTKVTQQAGPGAQKLGGDSSPGVVAAYLSIKNPLKIKGSSLRDADIDISSDQAFEILKNSPDIKNMESTPLWNWIDLSGSDEITDDMIMDVAQNYTGSSLISLENDFFRDGATEFRTAVRDVLGYDGVVMEFENGTKHFVAWFPEQIKSAVGNVGTFDPKNPDIARGVVPTAGAAAGAAAMQDNEEQM
jgi:hypothetical protein